MGDEGAYYKPLQENASGARPAPAPPPPPPPPKPASFSSVSPSAARKSSAGAGTESEQPVKRGSLVDQFAAMLPRRKSGVDSRRSSRASGEQHGNVEESQTPTPSTLVSLLSANATARPSRGDSLGSGIPPSVGEHRPSAYSLSSTGRGSPVESRAASSSVASTRRGPSSSVSFSVNSGWTPTKGDRSRGNVSIASVSEAGFQLPTEDPEVGRNPSPVPSVNGVPVAEQTVAKKKNRSASFFDRMLNVGIDVRERVSVWQQYARWDYVFQFLDDSTLAEHSQEREIARLDRFAVVSRIRAVGLRVSRPQRRLGHIYVRVHCPDDRLAKFAEALGLRKALSEQGKGHVLEGKISSMTRYYPQKAFDVNLSNAPDHAMFSVRRSHLGHFEQAKFGEGQFSSGERNAIVFEMLTRPPSFGEDGRMRNLCGAGLDLENNSLAHRWPTGASSFASIIHDEETSSNWEEKAGQFNGWANVYGDESTDAVGSARKSFTDSFPFHTPIREQLVQTWAFALLKPFRRTSTGRWTLLQPIDEIQGYLGGVVAHRFAFLGLYSTWLLPLSIVGSITYVYGLALPMDSGGGASLSMYAIFLSLWAIFFAKYYERRLNVLRHRWVTTKPLNGDGTENIRGEYMAAASKVHSNGLKGTPHPVTGLLGPSRMRSLALGFILSLPVMLLLSGLSVLVTFVIFTLKGAMEESTMVFGVILAGLLTGVWIRTASSLVWPVCIRLTKWELHETPSEHYTSLIVKMFLFEVFNSYFPVFYMVALRYKAHLLSGAKDTCHHSCMDDLHGYFASMVMAYAILDLSRDVFMPLITLHRGKDVGQDLEKAALENGSASERQVEMERRKGRPDVIDSIGCHLASVVQYGHLVMFSAAFPLASMVFLVVNNVAIRSQSARMLFSERRPHWAVDVVGNVWHRLVWALTAGAIATNALILTVTSDALAQYGVVSGVARMVSLVVLQNILFVGFLMVSLGVPSVPGWLFRMRACETSQSFLDALEEHDKRNLSREDVNVLDIYPYGSDDERVASLGGRSGSLTEWQESLERRPISLSVDAEVGNTLAVVFSDIEADRRDAVEAEWKEKLLVIRKDLHDAAALLRESELDRLRATVFEEFQENEGEVREAVWRDVLRRVENEMSGEVEDTRKEMKRKAHKELDEELYMFMRDERQRRLIRAQRELDLLERQEREEHLNIVHERIRDELRNEEQEYRMNQWQLRMEKVRADLDAEELQMREEEIARRRRDRANTRLMGRQDRAVSFEDNMFGGDEGHGYDNDVPAASWLHIGRRRESVAAAQRYEDLTDEQRLDDMVQPSLEEIEQDEELMDDVPKRKDGLTDSMRIKSKAWSTRRRSSGNSGRVLFPRGSTSSSVGSTTDLGSRRTSASGNGTDVGTVGSGGDGNRRMSGQVLLDFIRTRGGNEDTVNELPPEGGRARGVSSARPGFFAGLNERLSVVDVPPAIERIRALEAEKAAAGPKAESSNVMAGSPPPPPKPSLSVFSKSHEQHLQQMQGAVSNASTTSRSPAPPPKPKLSQFQVDGQLLLDNPALLKNAKVSREDVHKGRPLSGRELLYGASSDVSQNGE